MSKQTLYEETKDGGIQFISHRKGHHVRIPNYVYDLWLPIIGAKGIAVYSTYCRLEREGVVKAITQRKIARTLRIGGDTLKSTNEMLEKCGFIKVSVPQGYSRLMHHTTSIEIYDPPEKVEKEIIDEYGLDSGYEPLSTWLVKDESKTQPVSPQNTSEGFVETPDSVANVESLDVEALDVESLDLKDGDKSPSANPSEDYKQHLRDKFPEIAMGIPIAQKLNDVLDNLYDYPAHIQETIKAFSRKWKIPPPPKDSSDYSKWCKDATDVYKKCKNAQLTPEEVINEAYYIWKTPPKFLDVPRELYEGNYSVYDMGSVSKLVWIAVSNILSGQRQRRVKVYTDANGKEIEIEQ